MANGSRNGGVLGCKSTLREKPIHGVLYKVLTGYCIDWPIVHAAGAAARVPALYPYPFEKLPLCVNRR